MSDQDIEKEIQAKGKTAARITPDRINEVIAGYNTFNVGAALRALNVPTTSANDLLTMCVITLANGFMVTGESACASPENFDQEIGSKIALVNAKQKIWPLEGYLLKQRLYDHAVSLNSPTIVTAMGSLPPHQQRVVGEHAELADKTEKLAAFFSTPIFQSVDEAEKSRLRAQMDAMVTYGNILSQRISAF